MENFHTNQDVKNKRKDSFGRVASASEPSKQPVRPLSQKNPKPKLDEYSKSDNKNSSDKTDSENQSQPDKQPETQDTFVSLQDKVNKLKENKEQDQSEADKPSEETLKMSKGFTVGVTEEGYLKLIPFGSPDFLTLVGMLDFAEAKKSDILAQISSDRTHRSENTIGQLAKHTEALADGVSTLLTALTEQPKG